MFDTRTYSAIYTSLVTQFLSRRYGKGEVSKLSAHSTLSREFVDFLEFDLAYIIEALYNIVGSMILLSFYDTSIVAVCLGILLPVMATSYYYGKKMRRLTKLKNDELEKQVSIIAEGNQAVIKSHYGKLRKWQIKISDKEALNFGFMEIMVILVIAVSLLVSKSVLGTTIMAGNIIGIYNYLLKFVSGLDTIPYTVQRLSTLNDITRRIELQSEDFPETTPHNNVRGKKISIPRLLKLSA
jgi:ABC-type multidrug transport system fused ATPase/permease subunit